MWNVPVRVRGIFTEEAEVDLEDRFEQSHVSTLVETDLVLPEIDDGDFRGHEREQGRFAFEVLVHIVNKERNNAMVVVHTWSSPRSRPSVPSTSITMTLIALPRHIQIPVCSFYSISQTKVAKASPLVVCCRLVSSMTSKSSQTICSTVYLYNTSVSHFLTRKKLFVENPLFPVDCDPNTETMLYSNPESSRPHWSNCWFRSGCQHIRLSMQTEKQNASSTDVNLFSSSTICMDFVLAQGEAEPSWLFTAVPYGQDDDIWEAVVVVVQ